MAEERRNLHHNLPADRRSAGDGRVALATAKRLTAVLFGLLVLSRLVMLVPSFSDLMSGQGGGDLRARRAELVWVMHGVSPHLALERLKDEKLLEQLVQPSIENPQGSAARGAQGPALATLQDIAEGSFADDPGLAAYPHWSYPLYAALVWPSWPTTGVFYAGLLVCCIIGFCWWATTLFIGNWRWVALLVCLLPMPSWSVAVYTGQFSIPLVLLLAVLSIALRRGRWRCAGVLLGFAAMKPTSCTLFAFALLRPSVGSRSKWRGAIEAAAIAGGMVVGSSLLIWWRTGVDPWTAFQGLRAGNVAAASFGYGLMPLLARLGVPDDLLMTTFAVVGLGLALWVPWGLRRHTVLCQFAVFGLLSRLWAYHRHYDDLLLLFLLLALLHEVTRGSRLALAALLCMGMSLASPVPTSSLHEVGRVLVWVLSAAILVWESRDDRRAEGAVGLNSEPAHG